MCLPLVTSNCEHGSALLNWELAGVAGDETLLPVESELEGEAGFCRALPLVTGDQPGLLFGVDAAELDDGSGEFMAWRTLVIVAGFGESAPIVLLVEPEVVRGNAVTVVVPFFTAMLPVMLAPAVFAPEAFGLGLVCK